MSLKDKLRTEIEKAIKSGDKIRLQTLRGLIAAIQEKEVAKRPEKITEDDELAILLSSVKKRKESIELFKKGGRNDLLEIETSELKILEEFLPKQLSEGEVLIEVKKIIDRIGAASAKDFGKVMGIASKELKGKAEGKIISDCVKKLLG